MSLQAGLLGWPVAHSLSPRLHRYWLKQYAIAGDYTAIATPPDALERRIDACIAEGWRGFNLTIPLKEIILPYLSQLDSVAKRIGAVNKVTIQQGLLHGFNTDAYGFWENIRPHVTAKEKAVVIGAGGAARAVVDALHEQGFGSIFIVNRTLDRAHSLQATWPECRIIPWEQRAESLEGTDLLVNTTSLGMQGKAPLDLDLSSLPQAAVVNDIVYSPLVTPLLQAGRERGNCTIDGLGMLLHQAVPAFEAWFGLRPEVTEDLRQYVLS